MTVEYLKLFWFQIFVHRNLKLLDFLADFVLTTLYHAIESAVAKTMQRAMGRSSVTLLNIGNNFSVFCR